MSGRAPKCSACSSALGLEARHVAGRPCWLYRRDTRKNARRRAEKIARRSAENPGVDEKISPSLPPLASSSSSE